MEKSNSKSRKERNIALPQSLLQAQLGGAENFQKAKEAGDIQCVVNEGSGETFWAYKSLEIAAKEEIKLGSRGQGSHNVDTDAFRKLQVGHLLLPTHLTPS